MSECAGLRKRQARIAAKWGNYAVAKNFCFLKPMDVVISRKPFWKWIRADHHGSVTGHHDKVWSDMMVQPPIAVLSPFYHAGKRVPTDKDVTRIVMLAPESYITTQHPVPKSKISRPSSVERTIRETVGKIRAVQPSMGWVSLRNGGKSKPDRWDIVLSPSASRLSVLGGKIDSEYC